MAENSDLMTIQVITPTGLKYEHHCSFVLARTTTGDMGILPNMIPTIAALQIDELKVRRPDDEKHVNYIAVNGGIIEVNHNVITVIADSAEREKDIDLTRAERAKALAERQIELAKAEHKTDEVRRAEVSLHRALNRLNVGKHKL